MSALQHAAARWLSAHYDDLVGWRRHLHQHPELGRQEFATTQFVAAQLADAGLNPKVLPGGTGLLCDFGPDDGPRVALRADMDALPLDERTGAPYASLVPGVAHACCFGFCAQRECVRRRAFYVVAAVGVARSSSMSGKRR